MSQAQQPILNVPVIEFLPARLLHVTPPKTGSTSLLRAYMELASLASAGTPVRSAYRAAKQSGGAVQAGLYLHLVETRRLEEFISYRQGWHVICTVRNPYDRAVSNWHSKLNRYAKKYDFMTYIIGKICQLLEGPSAWPHIERANIHMQKRIPFHSMILGLARNGVEFDNHFEQQSRLLMLDRIKYENMIRLETMEADLLQALAKSGVSADLLAKLAKFPHLNRTHQKSIQSPLLDAEIIALIDKIYTDDKRLLGYTSPNYLELRAVDAL